MLTSQVVTVPLQKGVAVNEVHALARVGADIVDDEVVLVRGAANVRIERARPDLGVRRKLEVLL